MAFSSVLPSSISAGTQMIAVVLAAVLTLFPPKGSPRLVGLIAIVWAITLFWFILAFHPNVPDIQVGIVGTRKTVFCLLGLILGASVPRSASSAIERIIIGCLALAISASVFLFVFFPATEAALVDRSAADVYTGLFGGEARLQGVFAGPFHIAIAALLLIIWALTRMLTDPKLALICLTVGGFALHFANVRTAYVALIFGLVILVAVAPSANVLVKRLSIISALVFFVLVQVQIFAPERAQFFLGIVDFADDTRYLGRLAGYDSGFQMFTESPVWGWGAGSAGDTLGEEFGSNVHVTPHNLLLKIAVEGGLIGVVLWVILITAVLVHLPRKSPASSTAFAFLAVLGVMGLTGSAVEALPVTLFLFVLIGLHLYPARSSSRNSRRNGRSRVGLKTKEDWIHRGR